MGAVFGGSSSSTFGGRGAGGFLSRTTSVTAALFMITSLSLTVLSSRVDDESVISDDVVPLETTAPVAIPPTPGMGADIDTGAAPAVPEAKWGEEDNKTAPAPITKETPKSSQNTTK